MTGIPLSEIDASSTGRIPRGEGVGSERILRTLFVEGILLL